MYQHRYQHINSLDLGLESGQSQVNKNPLRVDDTDKDEELALALANSSSSC